MRRIRVILTIAAGVALALALSAQQGVEIETAPVKWRDVVVSDGEALFAELCAVCHGTDGKGAGPAAPALAVPTPNLTTLALSYDGVFPAAEVEKAISRRRSLLAHGTLEMPIWGRELEDVRPDFKPSRREAFASLRIHNLTAYLETLQVPAH